MNCPFCKKYINLDQPLRKYYDKITNQEYTLYKCNSCLGLFWYPLKTSTDYYENEISNDYTIWHLGLRKILPARNRMFFEEINHRNIQSKNIKLLDIGCADGLFLKEASKLGFDVYGIDFDGKSIEIAKNIHGLNNVYNMSLEEFYNHFKESNLKFNIITFFDVLEHQDNPSLFLSIINKLLENGGYAIGTVPNSSGFISDWAGFPPLHFLWFNKKNLENIFNLFGFKKVKIINVRENILELSSKSEGIIMGKFGLFLRKILTKKLLLTSQNNKISVSESNNKNNIRRRIFDIARKTRNYLFIPFTFILYPFIRDGGLYFEFKKV
jgi:2-polyprenyl-3-methyl-5-hydroxy-6-metoxy-1,4-benzoquinol methylase